MPQNPGLLENVTLEKCFLFIFSINQEVKRKSISGQQWSIQEEVSWFGDCLLQQNLKTHHGFYDASKGASEKCALMFCKIIIIIIIQLKQNCCNLTVTQNNSVNPPMTGREQKNRKFSAESKLRSSSPWDAVGWLETGCTCNEALKSSHN